MKFDRQFDAPVLDSSRVRILVPTYNRPEKLRELLGYLERQIGGPYPTIVVDDGGSAAAGPVCAEFGPWVSCLRQENQGPAAARNFGAAAAPDDAIICFTDDDCRPAPDWVKTLVEAQGGVAMRMVGGRVDNALPENPFSSASQAISSYLYEYYESGESDLRFFSSNNFCVLARDYRALGGFDTSFPMAAGEDRDFSIRWSGAGGALEYCPHAVIGHAHDLSFKRFMRQQANYGRAARKLHSDIAREEDDRRRFEKLGFYYGMLAYPFRQGGPRQIPYASLQAGLIAVSQVSLVLGYLNAPKEEHSPAGKARSPEAN